MKSRRGSPPLADVLGVLLPRSQDLAWLQACVGDAATVGDAWQRWCAARHTLPELLAHTPRARRMLALLHRSLVEARVELAAETLAVLRAATLWESHREARLRSLVGSILQALRRNGVDAMVTRGVALASSAYPEAHLRHCHDVDLATRADGLAAAQEALSTVGFHAISVRELRHVDGLPVRLHTDCTEAAWRRSRSLDFGGEIMHLPSPADSLLHVCGYIGPGMGADDMVWIADAAMLARSAGMHEGDWEVFSAEARCRTCLLPLAVRCLDLTARFGVSIPPIVIATLVQAAWHAPRAARDAAIRAAKQASGIRAAEFLKTSGWQSRFEILRWAVQR